MSRLLALRKHQEKWTRNTFEKCPNFSTLRSWVRNSRRCLKVELEVHEEFSRLELHCFAWYLYQQQKLNGLLMPALVRYYSYFAERAYQRTQSRSQQGDVERWYVAEAAVLSAQGVVGSRATFSGQPTVSAMQLTMAHFLRQRRLGKYESVEVTSWGDKPKE